MIDASAALQIVYIQLARQLEQEENIILLLSTEIETEVTIVELKVRNCN